MRKSVLKRVKITGTGKLLHRKPGQNHFNAKASRRSQLRRSKMTAFTPILAKKIHGYINQ
ncbi:MAG: hypothetical protein A3J58_03265 [Candidatus Sungbacteria bacterium RIFCSPHIGHO2_02_FULL_52_23]|uniref:50S ribosomal protein L35 n=1 Tax=Candidatus Sungbacteria bacterium RIFCSPHIGHO2_02_FULL_52_23 TaxID=1802274 RepID=A0A1G2KVR9_9BACT|nr:MAG: hypothetical protein A3J58_03265 [Candidatus Sungbacteria bacterium RIFCSPHIGHO2_02_FULL_52_23]